MALTVAGRYQQPSNIAMYMPVQDPQDPDSIYAITIQSGDYILIKFTWPDTWVEVANLSTGPTGKELYDAQIADGNFAWGLGYLSTDRHYIFYCVTHLVSTDNGTWYDINLEDGSVTTLDSAMGGAPAFQEWSFRGRVNLGYDGTGTYAYCATGGGGNAGNLVRKYIGVASGNAWKQSVSAAPTVEEDDQSYLGTLGLATIYRVTTHSAGQVSVASTLLPTLADVNALGLGTTYTSISGLTAHIPMVRRYWDDNNRYFFFYAAHAGGNDLFSCRKNVATGQWAITRVATDYDHTLGFLIQAFDVWKDDAGTERFYFSYGGKHGTIFGSEWPFVATNSLVVDTGGANIRGIHTTTGGYIYVVHYSGATYGSCITKVIDSDFEAAAASPSISLPGAVTLWKDKRVFFAGVTDYLRYLWWSQPYEPQSLDVGWDGYNTTIFDDENITALINLEDSIYCGSKKGWMRLRGKSPDHWILDHTLGQEGPMNNKTVVVTPYGAIYPRPDGLWIFNGYTSRLFFEQGKELMSQPNWDSADKMFSLWDGRYYRFFYPNGSATSNDRELIIDLIGGVDNARGTEADRAAAGGWADIPSGIVYLGDENGNILTEGGGSTSRSFEITSKEFPAQNLLMAGQFAKLHYDLDAAGAVVTITPIYDGVEKSGIAIPTNSTRTRSHILLPKGNAFRVGIKISASTDAAVKIYEPWVLE